MRLSLDFFQCRVSRHGPAFSEVNDFARTPPLTPLRLRLYIRHIGLDLQSRLYFPLSPFDFLLRQRTRIPTRWIYGTWTFTLGLITASTNAADRSSSATINLKARSRWSVRNPLAVLPPLLDNRPRLPRARNFPSKELMATLNFSSTVAELCSTRSWRRNKWPQRSFITDVLF